VSDHYNKKHTFEDQYRYIYFNHMNLAMKTSYNMKTKSADLDRATLKILNELHAEFKKSTDNSSEVLVRTANDRWIVARKSDQREFYVLFESKTAHLIEINDEVKKLSTTYFGNIFLEN